MHNTVNNEAKYLILWAPNLSHSVGLKYAKFKLNLVILPFLNAPLYDYYYLMDIKFLMLKVKIYDSV